MNEIINETECCQWRVISKRSIAELLNFKEYDMFLAVSLKNKSFSSRWLEAAFQDFGAFDANVTVTLVDVPYFENARNSFQGEILKREILKLEAIKQENESRILSLIPKFPCKSRFIAWELLEQQTDSRIKNELNSAYSKKGKVYDLLRGQTQKVVRNNMCFPSHDSFLLSEIPVLIDIYYNKFTDSIDVYPGEQFSFFWELESGKLKDELPLMTAMALDSKGHIYANVQGGQNYSEEKASLYQVAV